MKKQLLDTVWMVVAHDNKGVIYALGTSAKGVWEEIINREVMGTGATRTYLENLGYRAKRVKLVLA